MRDLNSAAPARDASKVPLKVYGVMALTTTLTFTTLLGGYHLLFPPQPLFA